MGGNDFELRISVLVLRYALKGGILITSFTCHLKKYRQAAALTQDELAQRVGVRRETIIRLEAGKYNPSLKLALDIAKVVNAPIEALFVFE